VAKPEWGTKRICHSCGTRFYDLLRDPIVCPSCGTEFDPEALLRTRRSRSVVSEREPAVVEAAAPEPEAPEVEVEAEVEVAGWDEAFLAVAADDPEILAREIQQRVLRRTRLWCTIGIGDNRLQAKLASGFGKPRGVFVLTSDRWNETMFGLTTSELWGIGRKTAPKLEGLGIRTVEELANADEEMLAARFGPSTGPWLRRLGTGEDESPVSSEPYVPRGRGRERTFQQDITDPEEVRSEVTTLARQLAEDLKDEVEERF